MKNKSIVVKLFLITSTVLIAFLLISLIFQIGFFQKFYENEKAKIVKNKVAAPFRITEFDIMYNEGISIPGDLLDTGVEYKVIDKSGNTYKFKDERLGIGREKTKMFMKENPKIMEEIRAKIWKVLEQGAAPAEEAGKPGEDVKKEDAPQAK